MNFNKKLGSIKSNHITKGVVEMATAFFKLNVEFTMKDDKSDDDNETVQSQYIPEVSDGIILDFISSDGATISFTAHKVEIDDGALTVEKNGNDLVVKCTAVFKKNAKPEHIETINEGDGKWYSTGLKGVYGLIDGLAEEKYKYKNRFGEGEAIRYLIPVELSSKRIKL